MGYFQDKLDGYRADRAFYHKTLEEERVKAQRREHERRMSLLREKARAKAEYEALPLHAKLAHLGARMRRKILQIEAKLERIRS